MAERLAPARLVASRWWDPALALALTGVNLIEWLARPELHGSPRAAVAVVVACGAVALRRTQPLAAVAIQATMVLITSYDNTMPQTAVLPIAVVAYSCGAHAARSRGLLAVLALVAAMQVGTGFSEFPNVEITFVTLGPWWIGRQLGLRRELLGDLAERTAELEAEQDAFARLSVRRERARIARELHDIVAHHLAVIVVQAGAGRMASAEQEHENTERLAAIGQAGGQALTEMARLVDLLEGETGDGSGILGKLRVLVEQADAAGVAVRFTPPPSELTLPAEIQDCAYRVVQEGLTNAIKHAAGSDVHVRVGAHDGGLEIEVRDTGAAGSSALATTGSGVGLAGMRRRVESLGGRMNAAPVPGSGWHLTATLPTRTSAGVGQVRLVG